MTSEQSLAPDLTEKARLQRYNAVHILQVYIGIGRGAKRTEAS